MGSESDTQSGSSFNVSIVTILKIVNKCRPISFSPRHRPDVALYEGREQARDGGAYQRSVQASADIRSESLMVYCISIDIEFNNVCVHTSITYKL